MDVNCLFCTSHDKNREHVDITTWFLPFQLWGDPEDITIRMEDWAIEDGLDWEDGGRCDEGNKMIGTWWSTGRKCSQGREHETPRGGTVPENMRWWITLVNAFERWKWHFKLVWGNCFVKCYIIYDLDHMHCGFMSITLLWEDETKWKKRSWNSSPSQGASTWCSHWVSLTYKHKENWTQKC